MSAPKKLFDQIDQFCKNHSFIMGWGLFEKKDDGTYQVELSPISIHCLAGAYDEGPILERLRGIEGGHKIGQAGYYEFKALLCYTPPQVGGYPPPNVEASDWWELLHIEYKLTAV